MSFWELTPDVTDLLCTLPPARDGICSCSHVGGYMFPHLPFRGGASAQDVLNSWPLLWPKPVQVVVIKIPPGAVQKTILMTTWLQEGESVVRLAEGMQAPRRLIAPDSWCTELRNGSATGPGVLRRFGEYFYLWLQDVTESRSSWTLRPVKEKVELLSPRACWDG